MTLIAHISLAAAALIALCGMLRNDIAALSKNGFSNKRFYSHLQESGDITSTTRIIALAILMGSITSMARDSWMVVLILAVVLAATGIYLLSKKRPDASHFNGRATGVYGSSLILSTVAVPAAVSFSMSPDTINSTYTYDTAQAMLLCAVISPLLVILSNWLLGLFMKNEENDTKSSDDK